MVDFTLRLVAVELIAKQHKPILLEAPAFFLLFIDVSLELNRLLIATLLARRLAARARIPTIAECRRAELQVGTCGVLSDLDLVAYPEKYSLLDLR